MLSYMFGFLTPRRCAGGAVTTQDIKSVTYNDFHTMLKHFNNMRGSNRLTAGFGRAHITFVLLTISRVEAQDDCAAGQYRAAGSSVCALCPAGLFSDSTTSTECTKCAAGTFSRGGSSECTDCAAGQYDHYSSAT